MSYFGGLFRGKLVRQWSHVWDTLVSYSSELYPADCSMILSVPMRRDWLTQATLVSTMSSATYR